jgi:hypothetical protein
LNGTVKTAQPCNLWLIMLDYVNLCGTYIHPDYWTVGFSLLKIREKKVCSEKNNCMPVIITA